MEADVFLKYKFPSLSCVNRADCGTTRSCADLCVREIDSDPIQPYRAELMRMQHEGEDQEGGTCVIDLRPSRRAWLSPIQQSQQPFLPARKWQRNGNATENIDGARVKKCQSIIAL
jgi:hypothetical protein